MMRKIPRPPYVAAVMITTALLAGCADNHGGIHRAPGDQSPPSAATTGPVYKVGKPYQVAGVWYYPAEDFGYDESGIASWYGPNFHGNLTANGEQYDQNAITAAHKTLPLPCVVRVTNLENGRSLVVRINDRGPFVNGRIIDLSRRSAQMLGMEGQGTARVRVQVMADESRAIATRMRRDGPSTEPAIAAAPRESVTAEALPMPGQSRATPASATGPAPISPSQQRMDAAALAADREVGQVRDDPVHATNIYVQAGTFSRYDNALRLKAHLSSIGPADIQQTSVKGQPMFRVRLGPTASVEDADRMLDQVIGTGLQDARVVVD